VREMAGYRFWKFSRSGGNTLKVVPSSQSIRREFFSARNCRFYLKEIGKPFGPKKSGT